MQPATFAQTPATLCFAGTDTASDVASPFGVRSAPAIEVGICRFLAAHPASSALMVAQHVWAEVPETGRDLHVDSWLWIREQMETLAARGILRRQQQNGAQLWWLSEPAMPAPAELPLAA